MGNEFIPVLIQTTVWEPFYWDGLRCDISEQVLAIIDDNELTEEDKVEKLLQLLREKRPLDIADHREGRPEASSNPSEHG